MLFPLESVRSRIFPINADSVSNDPELPLLCWPDLQMPGMPFVWETSHEI